MALLDAAFLKKLDRLLLGSNRRRSGTRGGERKSSRRGQSQEFADHRPYVPGDDLRFLDWHLYGRLDTLWIKLFEEESDRTVQMLIDCSASMEGEKLAYARTVAAALSWVALGRSDRVVVGGFDQTVKHYAPPRRGRQAAQGVFDTLEAVHPGGTTNPDGAFAAWPRHRGGGIICLFSDMWYPDGVDAPLRRLAARGDEVHVFHVLTPAEPNPPLAGDLNLIDRETGEALKVTVTAAVRERYLARLHEYCEAVAAACKKAGVTYVPLRTDVPIEQLILHDLRKQGVVV